jgi:hypothetical protein
MDYNSNKKKGKKNNGRNVAFKTESENDSDGDDKDVEDKPEMKVKGHLCLLSMRQAIWFDGVACWGNSACYSSMGILCTRTYQKK